MINHCRSILYIETQLLKYVTEKESDSEYYLFKTDMLESLYPKTWSFLYFASYNIQKLLMHVTGLHREGLCYNGAFTSQNIIFHHDAFTVVNVSTVSFSAGLYVGIIQYYANPPCYNTYYPTTLVIVSTRTKK
uniref:Uncharacterized protein n=1 Tax=Oryza barthii TaxID=65489 RepID=A0A0D3G529_9ORYZ